MAENGSTFDNAAFTGDTKGMTSSQYKYDTGDGGDVRYAQPAQKPKPSAVVKALVVVLLLALVAVIVLAVVVYRLNDDNNNNISGNGDADGNVQSQTTTAMPNPDMCLTPDCVKASARIMKSLNPSVHPCDDFYEFSCGGWMQDQVLLDSESSLNALSELGKENNRQIQRFLKGPDNPAFLPPVRSARNLFQACMDLDTMEARGTAHFQAWLSTNLGEWPLISPTWDEDAFDVTEAVIKAIRLNALPIISMYPAQDSKNSSNYVLYVDQPNLGLPRSYLLRNRNDTYIKAQEAYHYNLAESMGFLDPSTARQDVADAMDFEIRLAQNCVPPEDRRDANALYNPTTLGELQDQYGDNDFNYTRFAIGMFSAQEIAIYDVTSDERVINKSPPFLANFTEILRTTPKKVIANYISWIITKGYMGVLTQVFRDHRQTYNEVLGGASSAPERDVFCTSVASGQMGFALGKKYVDDNFTPEAKSVALEMVDGLTGTFNDLLPEVTWMDQETRAAAMEKNEAIVRKIGYPPFMDNVTEFIKYYENFTYTSDQYFEAAVIMSVQGAAQVLRTLRQPVDKSKWAMSPQSVNAYYAPQNNEIVFPAGILQPPFFSKDYPQYLNYGGIGMVIGHEITHGFDDKGRQYNKDGNIFQWWTNASIDGFTSQKQCIVDQYDAYVVPSVNMSLNGVKTQGENIADNGGLKQSFKAYRKWVDAHGMEEPKLPGLDYSPDQLFFVQFAQMWCQVQRDQATATKLQNDVHSPGQYRVIGSGSNSIEFSQAFNCPKTSAMNPEKKCTVW